MESKEQKGLLERLLEEPCVSSYVRYLGAFKVVESDYGLFDKLARARDLNDFVQTVYSSVRVQERVLKRLEEGLRSGDYEVVGEVKEVDRAFRVGKDCISRIMDIAKENPRFVGSIIASLAVAYEGVKEARRGAR